MSAEITPKIIDTIINFYDENKININDLKSRAAALLETISASSQVIILTHPRPDEDAVGSAKVVELVAHTLNKPVTTIIFDELAKKFQWIKLQTSVVPEPDSLAENVQLSDSAGNVVVIILDIGDVARIQPYVQQLQRVEAKMLVIDHHRAVQSQDSSGIKYFSYSDFESTTELLWYLLYLTNFEVTPELATAILYGLCGDTEFYQDIALSPRIDLLRYFLKVSGANESLILLNSVRAQEESSFTIWSQIGQLLEVHQQVASICIPYKEYQEIVEKFGDFDFGDIAAKIRNIDGLAFSYVLVETRPNYVECSLRARVSSVDLHRIAESFGGGGHISAAAFRGNHEFEGVRKRLEKMVESVASGSYRTD